MLSRTTLFKPMLSRTVVSGTMLQNEAPQNVAILSNKEITLMQEYFCHSLSDEGLERVEALLEGLVYDEETEELDAILAVLTNLQV